VEFLLADTISNIGRTIMNILAIAGGFLIGNLLALIACRLAAKFALKKRLPYWLEGLIRVFVGILVAILVAYFVFGDGNWGFGGSGGGRPGGPGGDNSQQKSDEKADTKEKPVIVPKPKVEPKSTDETVKVIILRGASFPKSFRFDGYEEAVDVETAKQMLKQRLDMSKGKLKSVTFILYENSTAAKGTVVEELERFVSSKLELDVTFSNIAQPLP
jgi:hypothetical protein